jgi:hypothetical protein
MHIPEPIEEASKIVKLLWESVAVDFPHWHGWAFQYGESGVELVFYIAPETDARKLSSACFHLIRFVPVKIVHLPPFQNAGASNGVAPGRALLRPGTGVRALSDNNHCSPPCAGTVAAFFRTRGMQKPVWLLSNNHVLVNSESCLPIKVFTGAGNLISERVRAVPLKIDGNRVDAAVAELMDPAMVEAVYDPLELDSTVPFCLADGDTVQKFGVATRLTYGKVFHSRCTMRVLDCAENNNREFVDQIMIQSIPGKPSFLDNRDSGSLVVCGKRPAGLLFAITNFSAPGAAIGLATPWKTVIDELEKIIPGPLEMLLAKTSRGVKAL